MQPGVQPISREEWRKAGYVVSSLPDVLMVDREDRDLLERILAKSPGRKRGRPPIGPIAMTSAERSRKHRRDKQLKTLVSPSVRPALVNPCPEGEPVPVALLEKESKS